MARGRRRAAIVAWGAILVLGATAAAQDSARSGLPLLTEIKAVRALSPEEGAREYRVRIRGTVTHFDERQSSYSGLVIHDGHHGQFVLQPQPRPELTATWNMLKLGDAIELEGYTVRGGFAPNVQPVAIRKLGAGQIPEARRLPYSALLTGRYDCDYVEITGVVQRAWLSPAPEPHTLFAEVAIEGGVVRATFWDYEARDVERFIDARVRMRGNAGTLFGNTGQLRGVSLFAGRVRDVGVLEPPPAPFSLPVRSIGSIYNYSATGEVNRRIRVRGVVTGSIPGHPVAVNDFATTLTFRYIRHVIYVRDATGGARIETEQPTRVRPGDLIEVAGFPAVTPGKPILTNALMRVVGSQGEPTPVGVAEASVLTPEHDAELVRINGQLLSVLTTPTERVLVVRFGESVFEAGIERTAASEALHDIRPGSVVSLTGVYSYQGGLLPSFRLLLRSPGDVVLITAAPWWTFQHSAVMLLILGAGACAAAWWVRTTANRKRREYQAVLNERNRVARELHDTLEQGLAGITLQLEAVAGSLKASPERAQCSLDVARQMLRYSLEETRRSVMDLRSQALESRDLPGALTNLAKQMTLGGPTRADVRVEGQPHRLDASQEHHLLRIGLEALTNALKHAEATRIDILLQFRANETLLRVRDDGRGLVDGDASGRGERFGLQGVRERVDKIGGVFRIDSVPGQGTELIVRVPVQRKDVAMARAAWGK